jgi:hypothetical protein
MAVKLSALRAGRLLPTRKISDTHLCYRLSQAQSHSAAGRFRSIENSNYVIRTRNHDLQTSSIVLFKYKCNISK